VNNPYSLCLTDVCPVGAWTARDFRFRKRVWFLKPMPSICPSCARGCNIFIDQADQVVYRIWPRRNDQVNRSWACDAGRMAYHALNDRRLTQPLVKKGSVLAPATWEEALATAVKILKPGAGKLAAVVSAGAACEEGAAAMKLASALGASAPALLAGKPGDEDAILIRADKNANRAGLEKLGISGDPAAAVGKANAVLLLEALPIHDCELLGKAAVVLSPTHTKAVDQALVALPAAAFSETSGTWVNFQGIEQKFQPAMPPKGQARPALAILKDLAQRLGQRIE
jgi:NADH-quinone oxidoreductase subunit G